MNLADILKKSTLLQPFVEKTTQMQQLDRILHAFLPMAYKPYCQVISWSSPKLTLATPNPSWCHKVKFLTQDPEFMTQLKRRSKLDVCEIRVVVRVSHWEDSLNLPPKIIYPKPLLSQKSSDLVKALALDWEGNPGSEDETASSLLKQALLRLSDSLRQ